ncbi:MAG: hypothetical protein Q9219_007490 [cf. Caloplaca sp. 3 TL-2023]
MTFLKEMTMYCTICGGPMVQADDDPKSQSWLSKVLLLHRSSNRNGTPPEESKPPGAPEARILLLPAEYKCGPYFTLTNSANKKEVTACDVPTFANAFAPELYFPIHENCVKIAEWVAEARGSSPEKTWRKIYGVLNAQLDANVEENNKIQPVTNLMNAGKYGTLWQFQELEWVGGEGAERYEADPLNIPHLSSILYSYLADLSHPDTPLPEDFDPDDESQRPRSWGGEFPVPPIQMHPILPHLLDFERVPKAEKARNWVTLMRQLSSKEIIEPGGGVVGWEGEILNENEGATEGEEDGLDPGLRNQRRIWALVDDLLDAANEEKGRIVNSEAGDEAQYVREGIKQPQIEIIL